MFDFWPFNIARKRREAEEAELQRQIARKCREEYLRDYFETMRQMEQLEIAAHIASKRNKVIPLNDPRHPTKQPRPRPHLGGPFLREKPPAPPAPSPPPTRFVRDDRPPAPAPADDWSNNLLNPMNFASPLNPIYNNSSSDNSSSCDSGSSSDSSSSSSCDSSSSTD